MSIVRIMNCRRTKMDRICSRYGKTRNIYKTVVGKLYGPRGRTTRGKENIIKAKDIGCEYVARIQLAQDRI
jgi:hypothetical protein